MHIKNIFISLILVLFGIKTVIAQSSVEVVESYIIDQNITSKLIRKVIPNERFKEVLLYEYLQSIDPSDLDPEELTLYQFVQSEFNWDKIEWSNYKMYHYRLEQEVKKPTKFQFSTIIYSKHKNYALFYVEERCQHMCSNGHLILMELVDGEWRYRTTLYAWME